MKEIILSTETGSDVPLSMAEKYHIEIIPMHVIMDGVSYPDGSFPVQDIFDYYERTGKIPTTSAVNVDEYREFFLRIQSQHPGCVIFHFAYSSNASSSCQNARVAAGDLDDIHLIDTKKVTGGCIVYLLAAVDLIRSKKQPITDFEALADEIRDIAPRVACAFIPGSLDFLKAGGRVSNAAYLGASILNLKPLVEINAEGYLVATKKYRGSTEKIAPRFVREFVYDHNLNRDVIYLIHTPDTEKRILDNMRAAAVLLGYRECVDIPTSGVISSHSGPGSIALAGISDPETV